MEVFEGITSIKGAVLEMLEFKEILVYGASTVGDEVFGHFTANFAKKRAEKNIVMKAVIGKTTPKHMSEKDVKKITEIRNLKLFEGHKSAYFIYGDNLLTIFLSEELVAIKITSPILIESQKQLFNHLWKSANK